MTDLLGEVPVATEPDLVAARQAARTIAETLGFDRQDQSRIAAAVSEIARNALSHGGGGRVAFGAEEHVDGGLLIVRVSDQGPGIADLEAVLGGRLSVTQGRSLGISSARRLMDRFDIRSDGQGTTVTMIRQLLGRHLLPDQVAAAKSLLQGRKAVDPLAAMRDQNRELLQSLARLREREEEASRLNDELEDTNRGVVALYAELDQRAEQLRIASELKSRFLSHMSHEFRTPLNSILALSRLLLEGDDGPLTSEQEKQVGYIRRSAGDLLDLVNDLLDLAKVEAGKTEIRAEPFAIASLFGALRGSLRPLRSNPAVDLVFEDASGLPQMVSDESKVAQILRNFLSNALKFTNEGEVRVRAQYEPVTDFIVFHVQDSGVGIAPEHLDSIFEEFAQVDGPVQRQVKGTGIGLSLSRRLAEILGGEIFVQSTVGVGSTFTLSLPRRHPAAVLEAGLPSRVLIIDDDEAMRYVLRHYLKQDGIEVIEASDGMVGLRRIGDDRPDAVVLDLQMPVMDGFGVLDALRDDAGVGSGAGPAVVVVTSMAIDEALRQRLAGVGAILPKSGLTPEAVRAALMTATASRPGGGDA